MDVDKSVAILPSCAKDVISATCSLKDLACICKAETLEMLNQSIRSACSEPEAIYSRKYTHVACKVPVRDHGVKLDVITYVLSIVTLFCIVSRIFFKRFLTSKQRLDKDDWTIMSALPTGGTLVGLVVWGITKHGLGTDIWGVSDEDIKLYAILFFILSVLYIVLIAQIKLSLCFFYLNIFPGVTVRRLLWVTVGFHIACAVGFFLGLMFSCSPTNYQWQRFDIERRPFAQGHCLDLNAAGWSFATLSVVSDLWLIALPLTQVGKLNLHIKKKIGIILMFLTGGVITVISILRLGTMKTYYNSTNPTWDEWNVTWWSSIEICTGFICTSLPTMRLILIRIWPRTFGSDRSNSQSMTPLPKSKSSKPQLCSGLTLPTIQDCKEEATVYGTTHSRTGLCEEKNLPHENLDGDGHCLGATGSGQAEEMRRAGYKVPQGIPIESTQKDT
ncbi:hypothetical protein E4U09_004163 [Claviceps aff. purpurea]|uniref:Rhodopsin domain-containing protein n=1 Tax=Claviceps aff. purpurea TaxID=1967640 RepID=A0A9P7QEG3_9HYPO|nr:hypothetical protein E4U09_004163 [Claviceps aff. purpurea]